MTLLKSVLTVTESDDKVWDCRYDQFCPWEVGTKHGEDWSACSRKGCRQWQQAVETACDQWPSWIARCMVNLCQPVATLVLFYIYSRSMCPLKRDQYFPYHLQHHPTLYPLSTKTHCFQCSTVSTFSCMPNHNPNPDTVLCGHNVLLQTEWAVRLSISITVQDLTQSA